MLANSLYIHVQKVYYSIYNIYIYIYIYIYIFCNKFEQGSQLRRKPFTVDVMKINGNRQQIQVCNLLMLNTKNVAWLNWHVARHLTKKIEISPKKCANLTQKIFGGLATLQMQGLSLESLFTIFHQNLCHRVDANFLLIFFLIN